jgi:hypothetical protein
VENSVAEKQKLEMLTGHMAWCDLVTLALARREGEGANQRQRGGLRKVA